MFNFYTPLYSSIKITFKYYLRRRFRNRYKYFEKYEDEIVVLASFLFISSSFMFKTKKDQFYNFNWQSYFRIYRPRTLEIFVVCAVRYLLDINPDIENKKEIEGSIVDLKENFLTQYKTMFIEKHQNKTRKRFDVSIDMVKFEKLLQLVVKARKIYNEIPNEPSKVIDLVGYLNQWKEIAFDVFRYKAEYVLFSFLVNL